MINEPYINSDFRTAVEAHIFGNMLIKNTNSPLILGIFGPPGEGKTYQLDKILKDLGINQIMVSPGELESENAGYPAMLLRTLYLKAGILEKNQSTQTPSVLVINDIDTVMGNWGPLVQYTVNRQVIYGQLMAFCDFPNEVAGKQTRRVPIIITGNNPSILYSPLLRAGRMRLIAWEPTFEDKVKIVSHIFTCISDTEIKSLITKFPSEPISFWSDVYASMWENKTVSWMNSQPKAIMLSSLQKGTQYSIGSVSITINELMNIAEKLHCANIREKSFLQKKSKNVGENSYDDTYKFDNIH